MPGHHRVHGFSGGLRLVGAVAMSEQTPNLPARPVHPGESDKQVSLREFEQRIFSLEQQINDRMRSQRELVETRSNALQKALDLQASEIERRLQELNHAKQDAIINWRMSLPREVFETTVAEWHKWRELVSTQLITLQKVPGEINTVENQLATTTTALATLQSLPNDIASLHSQIGTITTLANKLSGALLLLGIMGMAGVVAFVLGIARLAGVMR